MTFQAVAQQFGDCLANNDYATAWSLLTKELQASTPPDAIKDAVATMTAYAPGSIQIAQVMDDCILEDWPDKQPGDLAVVYVALNGDNFSEAVTLTLAQYGDAAQIRHLAWGRP